MELQRQAQHGAPAGTGFDAVGAMGRQSGGCDVFGEARVAAGFKGRKGLFVGPGVPVGRRR